MQQDPLDQMSLVVLEIRSLKREIKSVNEDMRILSGEIKALNERMWSRELDIEKRIIPIEKKIAWFSTVTSATLLIIYETIKRFIP